MNKKEQVLAPALRFSEFKENWKRITLGDVATFDKGKGVSKSDIDEKGKTKCIRYGELYTIYNEKINKIKSKTNINTSDLKLSKTDDVLIPASGETSIDIATASCVTKEGIAIGGDINIIRSNYDGAFLAYYLNGKKKNDIAKIAQGSSIIHLYASHLKTLKLYQPIDNEEQKKISGFLSSVDDRIYHLTNKIDLLIKYKDDVTNGIFNQSLRFKNTDGKDFPKWSFIHLKILARKANKKNTDKKELPVFTNSAKKGIVYQNEYFDKDIANKNNLSGYYLVEKNYFVYNPRISEKAPVGPIKRNHLCKGLISPLYTVIEFNKDVNLEFMDIYFNSSHWHSYMKGVANYGARHDRMNIANKDFFDLPCPQPFIEEQKKIVTFLQSINKKIRLAEKQLVQAKHFKQGLLQQMFI